MNGHSDKQSEALDRLAELHRHWCNQCMGDPLACLNAPNCTLRDYMIALETPSSAAERSDAERELVNIANAERFNRERFRDDTEFADWAQSRCRHASALSHEGTINAEAQQSSVLAESPGARSESSGHPSQRGGDTVPAAASALSLRGVALRLAQSEAERLQKIAASALSSSDAQYTDQAVIRADALLAVDALFENLPFTRERVSAIVINIMERAFAVSATERSIRLDECRRILAALDAYHHASDYGPPIQERINELAAIPESGK